MHLPGPLDLGGSCPSWSGNPLLGGPMSLCNFIMSLSQFVNQAVYLEFESQCKARLRLLNERQIATAHKYRKNT